MLWKHTYYINATDQWNNAWNYNNQLYYFWRHFYSTFMSFNTKRTEREPREGHFIQPCLSISGLNMKMSRRVNKRQRDLGFEYFEKATFVRRYVLWILCLQMRDFIQSLLNGDNFLKIMLVCIVLFRLFSLLSLPHYLFSLILLWQPILMWLK